MKDWFKIPILSLLFVSMIVYVNGEEKTSLDLAGKIDEYMNRMVKTGFSGAVLIAKDGEIILSKGYGLADREKNIPITDETVFTIGSITKQFTGAAILKLSMMGKLSIQEPITKYFDDVPDDKKAITLHHLLTHTAGFPGAIGDDYDPVESDAFVRLAMETELNRPPGEIYEYSNVGYSLLGIIVERVSGQSYEAFLHENLFQPSGMTKTGYLLPEWNPEDFAQGYRGDRKWGTIRDHRWAKEGPGWHLRANGGILSTVKDMYKWHLALEGDQILSDEAKEAFFSPHVREGEDAESFYGYGWAIFTTPRNTRLIAHNGGNGIFAADFLRYVDEDVVIIAMSNTAGKPAMKASRVISRIVFGEPYSLPLENPRIFTQEDLVELPQGKRALAFIDHLANPNEEALQLFVENNFISETVKNRKERIVGFMRRDGARLGAVKLKRVIQAEEDALELTVQSKTTGEWLRFIFRFEKNDPHRIVGIGVDNAMPPEETPGEMYKDLKALAEKWELPQSPTGLRGSAILEALKRQDDVYVREFIQGNISDDLFEEVSVEKLDRMFKEWSHEIGDFELLGAMKTGPYSAMLKIRSLHAEKLYKIVYELVSIPPHRIRDVKIVETE